MTARPGSRRGRSGTAAGDPFPPARLPDALLDDARRCTDAVDAAALISAHLTTVHGAEPDHRDDRDRWVAWLDAVEHRPLEAAISGALDEGGPIYV